MMQGLLGKKLGMTQVFSETGGQLPVTVLEVGPCVVLQRKTQATDGYEAVQIGYDDQKPHRLTKPLLGHFAKAGCAPKRHVREFRVEAGEAYEPGQVLTVSLFNDVPFVDVTGVGKGRGFQGVVKRHRMAQGRMSHGGHSKRRPGSIGQSAYPGRVYKGKRMPGRMGGRRVCQRGLKVVSLSEDEHILLVLGAVPGPAGQLVTVRKSLKAGKKAQ